MSKTPGQKACEAAARLGWSLGGNDARAWDELYEEDRAEWEAIAEAVTAPEPETDGELFREAMRSEGWPVFDADLVEFDRMAAKFVAERRKREGLE